MPIIYSCTQSSTAATVKLELKFPIFFVRVVMKKGLGEVPEIEFRLRNECALMCHKVFANFFRDWILCVL